MPRHVDTDSFGFLITDLSRMLRAELDRRITDAGLGLTSGEARTLVHAARAGTVRQNVLAERMAIEAMTVSGFLDRLEARGLVRRTPDPTDRRAKLVHLTEAADDVLHRIKAVSAGIRELAAQPLAAEEWEKLQALLKRVRAGLAENADCRKASDAA
jgi:DNA-binding MarR family transcriptional regulator